MKMFLNADWAERDDRSDVVNPYSGEAFDTEDAEELALGRGLQQPGNALMPVAFWYKLHATLF